MPEWGPWLFWPVYAYLAATVGSAFALLLRPLWRSGERVGWLVFFAPGAALLLPLGSVLLPHHPLVDGYAHQLWHRWEETLHTPGMAHNLLHLGNLALLLAGGICVVRAVGVLARMRGFAAALHPHAEPLEGTPVPLFRIPAARPFCFTVGWLRPRVYLSAGLEEQLSPEELRPILAHEAEHIRRRDGLVLGLLTLFYTLLPVPGRTLLMRDWEVSAERACDEAAAQAVGSRKAVARAVVRVAQLSTHVPLPGAAAFASAVGVEERIAALLAPAPGKQAASLQLQILLVVSVALLAAAGLPLQHVVELLVRH